MKSSRLLVLWASLLLTGVAQAQVETYTQHVDPFGAGWLGDGDPYGASFVQTINSSQFASLTNIAVTLNISSLNANGDVFAYISNDVSGRYAILLNRPGWNTINQSGYRDNGYNVTIDDLAGASRDIHTYHVTLGLGPNGNLSSPLTGSWSSDGRTAFVDGGFNIVDVYNTDPRSATLGNLDTAGLSPSGDWTLFIADLSSVGDVTLNSWALELMGVVPEPSSVLLLAGGLPALWWMVRRRKS
ncbi:MAG: PEP-CTERM sorting domain-containing protein [Verrucomicrobia bacterium]|nr:PEP-CTERM sorting domain-containing protein [Verrucomicrobiota bacterium]